MPTKAKLPTNELTEYDLVVSPIGYFNKREITNQDPRALVVGSKNVLINDSDKVVSRPGFTKDGQASTVNEGIDKTYDFISRNGKVIVRPFQGATANTGKLQVRVTKADDTIQWYDLLTGLTYTDFNYSSWWDDAESTRVMLFVDGTVNLRMWSGAMAFIASNTATTITISGTKTWAQLGFLVSLAGRSVTIPGVGTYAYTGGETTMTLTGLTGLPALTVGDPVFQGVVTTTAPTSLPAGTLYDLIMTKDNHVCLGYTASSVIYGSKTGDYTDYGFTTPLRLATDGFKITIDSFTTAFTQDSTSIFIFGGFDDIYKVDFILNAAQSGESITVDKLRAGAGQSAISQGAVIPVKNGIMYITFEKTLSWLTSVENIFTPQSLPISDPIKLDFDSYDLTGVKGVFYKNALWLAIPAENLVRIYDFNKQLWQPPQTIPISGFSIVGDDLLGHSNSKNLSYVLNDGLDDDGVTIEFVAAFAYRQFGNRSVLHQFDEYYQELYMSVATTVIATHKYEYQGSEIIIPKSIIGSDAGLKFAIASDSNMGKNNLGKNPLGSTTGAVSSLNKYRCIHEIKLVDFFEHQVVFSSDSENAQFEILAHGPNVVVSSNIPRSIKR